MKLRAKLVRSASLLREKVFPKFIEMQSNSDSTNEVQMLKLLPASEHAQQTPVLFQAPTFHSSLSALTQNHSSFGFHPSRLPRAQAEREGSDCPNSKKSVATSQNQQNKGGTHSLLSHAARPLWVTGRSTGNSHLAG